MSWMDTWSRPSKSQAIPAPYYLLPGGEDTAYCHSCGRVVSSRRTNAAAGAKTPTKYCSARCRGHRPGKLDRQLEEAFVLFLSGGEAFEDGRKGRDRHVKGESRILVPCSVVERHVFGEEEAGGQDGEGEASDQEEASKKAAAEDSETKRSGPKSDSDSDYQPTSVPQANEVFERFNDEGVAGIAVHDPTEQQQPRQQAKAGKGKKKKPKKDDSKKEDSKEGGEVGELEEKQKQGQRRARHKEMAKCAARRGVVFGFSIEGSDEKRLCEAVVGGKVVEPSYAKGDWAIRWRE
ncbi:hypothetical protein F5X68DRAFT_195546 [Plectosphaerella plurivora]|uniref:Uncharacterized protein n=1 Tax=Plectosphaerella plurivora TaxID=936078 RepID=A0A9P8UYU7_9PEZI|nr:hypothetical protein F5X68DRAFT_195546 [Plectosphaerella plurivora]